MKAKARKLGTAPPVALILNQDGSITMVDGSKVEVYLRSVLKRWKELGHPIDGPLEVSLLPRDTMHQLETEALLYRSRGA